MVGPWSRRRAPTTASYEMVRCRADRAQTAPGFAHEGVCDDALVPEELAEAPQVRVELRARIRASRRDAHAEDLDRAAVIEVSRDGAAGDSHADEPIVFGREADADLVADDRPTVPMVRRDERVRRRERDGDDAVRDALTVLGSRRRRRAVASCSVVPRVPRCCTGVCRTLREC